ncbi:hypothetical protein BTU70_011650, partial [Klebsiella pneumoniae]
RALAVGGAAAGWALKGCAFQPGGGAGGCCVSAPSREAGGKRACWAAPGSGADGGLLFRIFGFPRRWTKRCTI